MMVPGEAVAQPELVSMGLCGKDNKTEVYIQKNINNGTNNRICLWVQIGVNVNSNKTVEQLDWCVLLPGKEEGVQIKLSDGEFFIKK